MRLFHDETPEEIPEDDGESSAIKVTVNLNPSDSLQYSQWPVEDKQGRRIGFEFKGLSYSFILNDPVVMEVYNIDENGEIGDVIHSQEIKVARKIVEEISESKIVPFDLREATGIF